MSSTATNNPPNSNTDWKERPADQPKPILKNSRSAEQSTPAPAKTVRFSKRIARIRRFTIDSQDNRNNTAPAVKLHRSIREILLSGYTTKEPLDNPNSNLSRTETKHKANSPTVYKVSDTASSIVASSTPATKQNTTIPIPAGAVGATATTKDITLNNTDKELRSVATAAVAISARPRDVDQRSTVNRMPNLAETAALRRSCPRPMFSSQEPKNCRSAGHLNKNRLDDELRRQLEINQPEVFRKPPPRPWVPYNFDNPNPSRYVVLNMSILRGYAGVGSLRSMMPGIVNSGESGKKTRENRMAQEASQENVPSESEMREREKKDDTNTSTKTSSPPPSNETEKTYSEDEDDSSGAVTESSDSSGPGDLEAKKG